VLVNGVTLHDTHAHVLRVRHTDVAQRDV